MIVVVGPGQGAQTPGFLEPWLADPALRAQLESWSEVVGIDLVAHGTVSDADTIRDTAIAQPLIVAAGLLSLGALLDGNADREAAIGGYAGHSVGEITAAAASGVLSTEDALRFVAARGRAMADAAAAAEPTGMSAVLGGDEDALLARLEELGLSPANFNGGGWLAPSTPAPWTRHARCSLTSPLHSPPPTHAPRSGRTRAAPWSPRALHSWTCWCIRLLPRSAGIRCKRPWQMQESPA